MAAPVKGNTLESALKPVLHKFLDEVRGLHGVVVSSTDSVCFCKAFKEDEASPVIATMFPFIAEQVGKLQWGPLRSVTAEFEEARIVHLNLAPLVFTFVGKEDLDMDALTSDELFERLRNGFEPLSDVLHAEHNSQEKKLLLL